MSSPPPSGIYVRRMSWERSCHTVNSYGEVWEGGKISAPEGKPTSAPTDDFKAFSIGVPID
jgi:hypothetical protein